MRGVLVESAGNHGIELSLETIKKDLLMEIEILNEEDLIQTLNFENFKHEVLMFRGAQVVEFMSYSCSHCGELEPALQQVAKFMKSKIKFYRVNTANESKLVSNYSIDSTPTLIMFFNGKNIGRIVGPAPTIASLLTAISQPYRGIL